MKQYQELLTKILHKGVEKGSGRDNMPEVKGISHATMEFNLEDGFPLLTTKEIYWKGVVRELLWFLRGETNIKSLVDQNVNIWNDDAYRWYLKLHREKTGFDGSYSIDTFIYHIKEGELEATSLAEYGYKLGDLGKVYGHQWRNQNGVDQLKDIYTDLIYRPLSRYKIIDGWNKADFPEMALPPCHLLYQFICRPLSIEQRRAHYYKLIKAESNIIPGLDLEHSDLDLLIIPRYYLDLNMYQRSCDTFLGVPFNIASMSFLLLIMATAAKMVPGDVFWIGGDTHLYLDHIPMVDIQLKRAPKKLPQVKLNARIDSFEDILKLTDGDFEVIGYDPHPQIKAPLFVGLQK